jgi:AraC-like DNA-binding protein
MSVSQFHVSGNVASVLLEYLHALGAVDPELHESIARFDARRPMRNEQWWAFLQQVQQQYPQRPVGLEIGARLRLHHLGALGYVLANAPSAAEAWGLFERYQPSLFNGGFGEMRIQAGQLCLEWGNDYAVEVAELSDHVLMSATIGVARQLTRRPDLAPTRIEWMGEVPPQTSAFADYFRCPMSFNCPSLRLWLPAAAMQLPLFPPEPMQMERMLRADTTVPTLSDSDDLLRALHNQLLLHMQQGHPHIDAIAAGVGLSRRSLQRFLRRYGVSYSTMLDTARRRMACVYLRDGQVSLAEIALLLGFSEQSAFNRAFRRWLGVSPTDYLRQQQAAEQSG